jgi:hypothetical protein
MRAGEAARASEAVCANEMGDEMTGSSGARVSTSRRLPQRAAQLHRLTQSAKRTSEAAWSFIQWPPSRANCGRVHTPVTLNFVHETPALRTRAQFRARFRWRMMRL